MTMDWQPMRLRLDHAGGIAAVWKHAGFWRWHMEEGEASRGLESTREVAMTLVEAEIKKARAERRALPDVRVLFERRDGHWEVSVDGGTPMGGVSFFVMQGNAGGMTLMSGTMTHPAGELIREALVGSGEDGS